MMALQLGMTVESAGTGPVDVAALIESFWINVPYRFRVGNLGLIGQFVSMNADSIRSRSVKHAIQSELEKQCMNQLADANLSAVTSSAATPMVNIDINRLAKVLDQALDQQLAQQLQSNLDANADEAHDVRAAAPTAVQDQTALDLDFAMALQLQEEFNVRPVPFRQPNRGRFSSHDSMTNAGNQSFQRTKSPSRRIEGRIGFPGRLLERGTALSVDEAMTRHEAARRTLWRERHDEAPIWANDIVRNGTDAVAVAKGKENELITIEDSNAGQDTQSESGSTKEIRAPNFSAETPVRPEKSSFERALSSTVL